METKRERPYRSGIPMSEDELKEWKQTFVDIQESIDSVMSGEDNGNGTAGHDSGALCEERNKKRNA